MEMSTITEVEKLMMAMPLTALTKSMRLTNQAVGYGLPEQDLTVRVCHIQGIGLMIANQLGHIDFHLSL